MRLFGIIIALMIIIMGIGAIIHEAYLKRKKEKIQPYGKVIDVYDGKMHVYSKGNGKKTIVLLPGQGVGLPTGEFGPLIRELSKKYTVVAVEYFGVGLSSETKRLRTCENYVEEIRTALGNAGFKAPYVLMPHSISSVYSEYYASKYPEEVEGIISLDGTSTAYLGEDMPGFVKSLLKVAKFQQVIGLTSLLAILTTNKINLINSGYNEKEISDMIAFAGFTINNNVLEQMANTAEFIKKTRDMPYPQTIPYFKVISKQTYETANKQLKITPQEYQKQHLERIGDQAAFEILDGNHFIYHNNIDRIAAITDEFLKE